MNVPDPESAFLAEAIRLAREAGDEILALHPSATVQTLKADHSPVTEADLKSNHIIFTGLRQAFNDHAILTEEAGLDGDLTAEYVWMIDPLDGTKAYAKKIPGFCVMIGLARRGIPYLGVVFDPLEGRLYEAIRGRGAYHSRGGKRQALQVSPRREFSEMPLILSTGFPEGSLKEIRAQLTGRMLDPINSVGIKAGLLVRGLGDIYLNHHTVHYWDTCAPQLIVEEAGGKFTRLDGKDLEYKLDGGFSHQSKTLASNGTRHQEIADIVKMDL